ncbi:CGNR zinc finger domain-containing protein (plasmid) [Streptomyces sp. BI20]|uniref:CGNR zinc finger domain-containing protein n=1 Tax=Streptomyces sp. BI20 TaxID=3403460 RepID=UPI003C728748
MLFDSHVAVVLENAVTLVNTLTDGSAGGRPYRAPTGAELPAAIERALSKVGGSLPRVIDEPQAAFLVTAARHMREVFEAVRDERPDTAAETVNTLLRETAARPRLDRTEEPGNPWRLHFHGPDDSFAAAHAAACATGLALAVGGALAGRLGVCEAERCDRVHMDTSRNATRRFCSPACQNRTKAAAFRARNTPTP